MKRSFTRSVDGVERCNLRAEIRVSRHLLAEYERLAAKEGVPLQKFLRQSLYDGLEAALLADEKDANELGASG